MSHDSDEFFATIADDSESPERPPSLYSGNLTEDVSAAQSFRLINYDGRNQGSTKDLYDDFQTIDWLKDVAIDRERNGLLTSRVGVLAKLIVMADAASGWILVFLVGAVAGLLAGVVDIGTNWIGSLREGVCLEAFWLDREHCCWSSANVSFDKNHGLESCPEFHEWHRIFSSAQWSSHVSFIGYLCNMFMYISLSVSYGFLVVMMVRIFAPYASGSGIAEIKTILSGFVMRGYLGKWTLLIKSVGMMLATSTSLVVGKEGPFVHIGCCCSNIISYIFPKYGKNEAKKREILSAGAAVGVAVAFGAPLGGVLFSLEEVSYYFPFKTLWRSFFCAMIGALVVRYINPSGRDIQFAIDYSVPWYYFELVNFAILGLLGGLWGAAFIKLNSCWCKFRKSRSLYKHALAEVLILSLLTAIIFYPNPYTRISMSKLIQLMVSKCTIQEAHIDLCNYSWKYPIDSAQSKLIPIGFGKGVANAVWQLFLAVVLLNVFMVFCINSKIPAGLMIPALCIGSVTGRILGVTMERIVLAYPNFFWFRYECGTLDQGCITPGLYALVGSCAFLAGITKMTVSLVVIMFEITGGLRYIVPLMVATMAAKWTADAFGRGGIYDGDIERKQYPFIDNKEDIRLPSIATDLLVSDDSIILGSSGNTFNGICFLTKRGMQLSELYTLLNQTRYPVIPIITSLEEMSLHGQIARKDIVEALKTINQQNNGRPQGRQAWVSFGADDFGQRNYDILNLGKLVDRAPIMISDKTPTETIVDLFRKMGLRHAYVTRDGRLLGVITKKDLIRHIHEHEN